MLYKIVNVYILLFYLIFLITIYLITKHGLFNNLHTIQHCQESESTLLQPYKTSIQNSIIYEYNTVTTGEDFNFEEDVLALLHIQKTSGSTWESHIWRHLYVKYSYETIWRPACIFYNQKRYTCLKNRLNKAIFWDRYMSRFCDIHADYTELKNCIMFDYKNRIFSPNPGIQSNGIVHFMTFLRDPVHRYLSEYEHTKRGKIIIIYFDKHCVIRRHILEFSQTTKIPFDN
jgi:hypothetical protein